MSSDKYITVGDLKNATVIQNNIEPKLLAPYIPIAQDININVILGAALVTPFQADLIDNGITVTAATQRFIDLLVYVKNAMFYCVAAEATTFLSVRITNKGINSRFSEFTATASEGAVKDVKNQFTNYAEFYKNQLLCFLADNKTTYPEWTNPDCRDDCKNVNLRYFSNFQFDKAAKKKYNY
jgi:hypothetical protein